MSAPVPKIGDVWYRVDGVWIDDGSESYCGMELQWQQWRVTKVTPSGAWFQSIEQPYKKQRFALTNGARWVSRTKADALSGLIARKLRHIKIVQFQATTASETLDLAKEALAKMEGGAA